MVVVSDVFLYWSGYWAVFGLVFRKEISMKSCALITPGHCASSLAIHRLKQEGYEVGPPGLVDGRRAMAALHTA